MTRERDPEATDPHGFPPPSDPQQVDAARLFATMVGEMLAPMRTEQAATKRALGAMADMITRDHVSTSRRLAILEATRLAPAMAAIVLSLAAFGFAALAASRPAIAEQRCPPAVESRR